LKVKVKRVDQDLPLPKYQTSGAVGCDMYARVTTNVPAHGLAKVPGNLIIECPKDYMFMIAPRSSTPSRKGLLFPNSVGIGDQDFCGPEDEWQVIVYNFTDQEVVVERGERIAQILFFPIAIADWEEVAEMTAPNRGGIGSTGHK